MLLSRKEQVRHTAVAAARVDSSVAEGVAAHLRKSRSAASRTDVQRVRFWGRITYLWLVGNGRMVVIVVIIVPHSSIPY